MTAKPAKEHQVTKALERFGSTSAARTSYLLRNVSATFFVGISTGKIYRQPPGLQKQLATFIVANRCAFARKDVLPKAILKAGDRAELYVHKAKKGEFGRALKDVTTAEQKLSKTKELQAGLVVSDPDDRTIYHLLFWRGHSERPPAYESILADAQSRMTSWKKYDLLLVNAPRG